MAQTADADNRSGFYQGAATSLAFSKDLLRRLMMDKGCKDESEDEMELNLGLSLGGCHHHHVKANKDKPGSVNLQLLDLHRKNCDGGVGLQRDGYGYGDDGGVDFGFGLKQEEASGIHESRSQQKKRELHALRRQEARKKREEKQLHRARREAEAAAAGGGGGGGIKSIQPDKVGRNQNGFVPLAPSYPPPFPMGGGGTVFPPMATVGNVSSQEDKRVLRAQMSSIRDKDRVVEENEPCGADTKERVCKTSSSRTCHEKENMVLCCNGGGGWPAKEKPPPATNEVSCPERSFPASQAGYPVMPISYPFPVLAANPRCMPVHMGYTFPYMMPFWPAASTAPESPNSPPLPPNVVQPVPTRPFPPFQMPVSEALQTGFFPETQKCPGTGPGHFSHASSRSSSAVSENETRSSRGACSNDSKTQSSASSLLRVSSATKTQDHSELSSASQIKSPSTWAEVADREKAPSNAEAEADESAAFATSTTTTTTTMRDKYNQITEASQQGCSSTPQVNNANFTKTCNDNRCVLPTKTCKGDESHDGESSFGNMPCVSTTSEGGKTINGFLYSYREGEVSIVCVCHGKFLSPAEFVEHAGRTDVSHPERHIVVNTSLSATQHAPAPAPAPAPA